MHARPHPETAVPAGETPAARCPHCDRPFRTEQRRALHVGEAHHTTASETERDAYEAAFTAESEELFVYHLKVVAGLSVVYAAFVIVYMIVLG